MKEDKAKKTTGQADLLSDEGIQKKIEDTLLALYQLQQHDSQADKTDFLHFSSLLILI